MTPSLPRTTTPPITSFTGEHTFLSNFAPSPLTYLGIEDWPTVEHAYQAAKTLDVAEQRKIWVSPKPGNAKAMGRRVTLRPDWEDVKVDIMRELIRLKFTAPTLRLWLKNTGDAPLVEGNTWNDTFWGVCKGRGLNMLGILLMEERARLWPELPMTHD